MRVIHEAAQRVPLWSWAERIDPLSLRTLQKLARSRLLHGPVAVMPDVHSAGAVCVGTVLATREAVLCTAVGQDLGCGMRVTQLSCAAPPRQTLERLLPPLLDAIPCGRRTHRVPQPLPEAVRTMELSHKALQHEWSFLAPRHLGTLGGGNHFLELQADSAGGLWLTVHTGSRGPGAITASVHGRHAAQDEDAVLPYVARGTPEFQHFWHDFECALQFAAANRERLTAVAVDLLRCTLGEPVEILASTDVAHNTITRARSASSPVRWRLRVTSSKGAATLARMRHARTGLAARSRGNRRAHKSH